jgi:hypothetical protein
MFLDAVGTAPNRIPVSPQPEHQPGERRAMHSGADVSSAVFLDEVMKAASITLRGEIIMMLVLIAIGGFQSDAGC